MVRGLSDRDIEASLADVLGSEAALSRSTVSRICQRIPDEFGTWKSRSLENVHLDYLFWDGSHFKMHPGASGRAGAGRLGLLARGHHQPGQGQRPCEWRDSVGRRQRAQIRRRCDELLARIEAEPKTEDWHQRAEKGLAKIRYKQGFADWWRHGKRGAEPSGLRIAVAGGPWTAYSEAIGLLRAPSRHKGD
jgi:hypothetical protein